MAKEICISSTPHETRLAILEDDQLAEIYYERENEYTLAGSIYKGRVTRVLPGMQSAFVDLGLERDAFLYVTDFLEEQEEDSEEFDTNGGGRKPRESREPRDSREPREQRSRPQENGGEMSAAEVPAPRPDRDRGRDQDHGGEGGNRRWQGRRGRRFGGRGPRSDQRSDRPDRSESRSDQRSDQRPEPRSDQRFLDSPEIVAEAISAEPVARPERGAPGGIPAQNLPIVLPGESLSKYGSRGESRSSSPAELLPAPRLRRAAAASNPPPWSKSPPVGMAARPCLEKRSSRHRRSESRAGNSQAAPTENWAAEPAVATAAPEESAVAAVPAPENVPVENPATAAPLFRKRLRRRGAVEHAAATVAPREPEIETVEEVHEYEPEDASASHRVERRAANSASLPLRRKKRHISKSDSGSPD